MNQTLHNRLVKQLHRGGLIRRVLVKSSPLEGLFTARFSKLAVDRPIFIVGVPRSGTSILYEVLQKHPDLAYLTQASDYFPAIPITANRFFKYTGLTHLHPTGIENREWAEYGFNFAEGYKTWSYFSPDQSILTAEDVTDEQRLFYRQVVQKHMYLTGRSRFISKSPFNSLRIGYLNEIFPDALFVHIYRDGRAVARSILEMRVRYGGIRARFGPMPPELVEDETMEPLVACGLQWKYTLKHIHEALSLVAPERQFTIAYEPFAEKPVQTIRELLTFCDLSEDANVIEAAHSVSNRNSNWQKGFTPGQVKSLESSISGTLLELGYVP